MTEYIEREKAMFQIDVADFVRDNDFQGGATLLFYDDVVDRLSAIPAADVRPVVRGKWTKKNDDVCYWFECSVCGQRPPWNEWGTEWQSPFCPNCGADMREES